MVYCQQFKDFLIKLTFTFVCCTFLALIIWILVDTFNPSFDRSCPTMNCTRNIWYGQIPCVDGDKGKMIGWTTHGSDYWIYYKCKYPTGRIDLPGPGTLWGLGKIIAFIMIISFGSTFIVLFTYYTCTISLKIPYRQDKYISIWND